MRTGDLRPPTLEKGEDSLAWKYLYPMGGPVPRVKPAHTHGKVFG